MGILADAVSDIVDVDAASLRPAPDVANDGGDLLKGLVVKGSEVVALLDLPAIVMETAARAA